MDIKEFGGKATEVKQEQRDGVNIGIVAGYIATWDIDRGDYRYKDQFVRGAFIESIEDFKQKERMPRFKDGHGRTVGGWKYETLREDDRGLFGEAEINLDVQQGREAYMMAKQGVLTDFSIGFTADEFSIDESNNLRKIFKATFLEGSIVDEPMNPKANITDVKKATPFGDLPIADASRAWDSDAAIGRVRQFTNSAEEPTADYKKAFFYYDSENTENFTAYKLPFADVIDGKLTAVPRGIFAAAAAMRGARGGVDLPEGDRAAVESNINKYYAKMDRESPLKEKYLSISMLDLKYLTVREIEGILTNENARFTKKAGKKIISYLNVKGLCEEDSDIGRDAPKENEIVTKQLNEIINLLEA